jgi:corrinoid protein of di/trimethylamine methyltransferase
MQGEKAMSEAVYSKLHDAIIDFDADKAKEIAQKGIADGLDPVEMINQGIRQALELMGERFAAGNVFLPELMLAAQAADAAVRILEPEIIKGGGTQGQLGKVLIATVEGDIHDIGKNIVALVMKSAGFEVFDLGVNKKNKEILDAAKQHEVNVIGLSALLTTTIPRMKEFIELLQESGLRDKYKVVVGGAPVTKEFAEMIGADGYGADAPRASEVTRRLLGK